MECYASLEIKKENKKMKTVNVLASLFAILALVFVLAPVVSANEIINSYDVTIDGLSVYNNDVSVLAGEVITVKVYFNASEDDTDVTVEAELEGEKVQTIAVSEVFDVEAGKSYRKVLSLRVPYELKDDLSDDLSLEIEIDGREHKTVLEDAILRVQRPSYNVEIKSVVVPSSIEAGDTIPVDVVLRNMGYNEIEDLYVVVEIPELGISQGPHWFGDLVPVEVCEDDECKEDDTVLGRLYLEVPYTVKQGIYSLNVDLYSGDMTNKWSSICGTEGYTSSCISGSLELLEHCDEKKIFISNDFSNNIITSSTVKSVAVGEEAEYNLIVVNPTDKIQVYTLDVNSEDVSVDSEETVFAIPAMGSKTVTLYASADEEGDYSFDVSVVSTGKVVKTENFELEVEGNKSISPIVILTIVLAVIFLVLLVVLIVILSKKPESKEEMGESYY
jgi:hypothetical protein